MELITVTKENIDKEHICCAIADKKGENAASSKKAWLTKRFDDGLVFTKANVRGKVFIEYIPAENAWSPVEADNYMYINCLWVAGKYKGQGIANQLLQSCINDAKEKGKDGLVIFSSKKKVAYVSDAKFLLYKGFTVADTIDDYQLLYLPFNSEAKVPKFKDNARTFAIEDTGMVLYYSNQCPFVGRYVPIIEAIAKERGQKLTLIKYENAKQAQNAPVPFTTYSFFHHGKFVTNEIFSDKKFIKYLDEL